MGTLRKTPPQAHNSGHKPGPQSVQQLSHRPGVAQPKATIAALQIKRQPAPPPVYRPQPVPKVPQAKMPTPHQSLHRASGHAAAPPVYRPQPTPRVLQSKMASSQHLNAGTLPRRPKAPPVDRLEPQKIAQSKMAVQAGRPSPAYRPELKLLRPKLTKHAGAAKPDKIIQRTPEFAEVHGPNTQDCVSDSFVLNHMRSGTNFSEAEARRHHESTTRRTPNTIVDITRRDIANELWDYLSNLSPAESEESSSANTISFMTRNWYRQIETNYDVREGTASVTRQGRGRIRLMAAWVPDDRTFRGGHYYRPGYFQVYHFGF